MKLYIALLALFQQALCAPQPVDPADLHAALQSDRLDAWVERVAAKRQLSKDAVLANVQAVTYHLHSEDPHPADGKHPTLDRRQKPTREYPLLLEAENDNDRVTSNRIGDYNGLCRRANAQPLNSPFTPNNHVFSFWRAASGGCDGNTVTISCKLPRYYAPKGWAQDSSANTHVTRFPCAAGERCWLFKAHSFATTSPTVWGGCVKEFQTTQTVKQNRVTTYLDNHMCPISPGTWRYWDIFAETLDGQDVTWTLFTGVESQKVVVSRSPSFLIHTKVAWAGNDPGARPSLRFERVGVSASIRLYSHVYS